MAAEHGHQNIIRDLIIEFGENVDAQDKVLIVSEIITVVIIIWHLLYADWIYSLSQHDIIRQLLDLGGNPDIQDKVCTLIYVCLC